VRSPEAAARILLAAALAATAAAYAPAIPGELHFDDQATIADNAALRSPRALLASFHPLQLVGPERPVTQASLALDYAVGRLDPAAYHRTSLALHLAAAALVFLLARGAARRAGSAAPEGIGALVAAAFALHPLQAEAVAYAAQRSEVLAGALSLGALVALLASDGARTRRGAIGLAAGAAALHLLALGAKPVAAFVPAAYVLHRLLLPDPDAPPIVARLRAALARSAPLWILSAAAAVRLLVVLGPGSTAGLHAGGLGPWRYLLTELRAHWLYARLVAWPAGQSVDHALAPSPGLLHGPTLLALLGTAAAIALALAAARRAERGGDGAGRLVAFGIGLFLVALAPSSSVVPVQDLVAEHRAYVASSGLLLALVALADLLLRRAAGRLPPSLAPRLPRALALGALAALAALGVALHARAEVWGSDLALWAEAARVNPGSARAWVNLGRAHEGRGERAEALSAYRRGDALARGPAEVALATANLGAWYGEAGDSALALATLERGRSVAPRDPPVLLNRAAVLWRLGRLDEAEDGARNAIHVRPEGYPEGQRLLGLVLWDRGDREGALAAFAEARRLAPDVPVFAEQLFVALARSGRADAACAAWREIARSRWKGRMDAATRSLVATLGCR
jgi:tetratricopeptide (TPR) repeat protein